ncbi:MAG: hypothetical protein QM811_22755 [Pirellulales bacterium]
MNQPQRPSTPLFTQMDATLGPIPGPAPQPVSTTPMQVLHLQTTLLRDMLTAMDRQNELLEELVGCVTLQQKQRVAELKQWKQANPRLAKDCKMAADMLAKVQTEYLQELTDEVGTNAEEMQAGDFLFNEFVDRFGPRLAHLNGMLQVLAQLGNAPEPTGLGQV